MHTKAQGVRLFGLIGLFLSALGAIALISGGTRLGAFGAKHVILVFGLLFLFSSFAVHTELFGRQGRPFISRIWENILSLEHVTRGYRVRLYIVAAFASLYYATAFGTAYFTGDMKSPAIPFWLLVMGVLFLYLWKKDLPHMRRTR